MDGIVSVVEQAVDPSTEEEYYVNCKFIFSFANKISFLDYVYSITLIIT